MSTLAGADCISFDLGAASLAGDAYTLRDVTYTEPELRYVVRNVPREAGSAPLRRRWEARSS